MNSDMAAMREAGDRLDAFECSLMATIGRIVAALGKLGRGDGAVLEGLCHEVSAQVRRYPVLAAQLKAGQQAVAARAQAGAAPSATPVRMPQAWHDLNRRINTLRMALNLWPQVQALVARQGAARGWPLYPPPARRADPVLAARMAAGDRMLKRLGGMLNPSGQDPVMQARGCYGDVALPESWFIAHALAARRVRLAQGATGMAPGLRFLDVGCGGGLKLLTALELFDRATGLELDPGYAAAARGMVEASGVKACEILEGDALEFNGYDRFDVIYFFRPMRDDDALSRLERRICEDARPGTVLIAPYRGFAARHAAHGCGHVDGALYLSASSASAARRVRARAHHIGTDTVMPTLGARTIWATLLETSAARGFAVRMDDPLERV